MSEMVERVAKVMWEIRRARAQTMGLHLEEWDDGHWPKANGIMEEASAAIEAMRIPTSEMLEAALATELDEPHYYEAWQAMIDEALREIVTRGE